MKSHAPTKTTSLLEHSTFMMILQASLQLRIGLAHTALKTGRIEHAILEGNNIPPVDFAQLLADACTEQLKKLTLKQMSVDVLCDLRWHCIVKLIHPIRPMPMPNSQNSF